ncbi:hypothetical protein [Telluribacter humicola]|uniref:hypothetical protein n=1 Tax=Telluribacter humicola TaxID=1720261 RepID=UPI001A9587DB|nr:hypothetical protein [Telluribacter humicola]
MRKLILIQVVALAILTSSFVFSKRDNEKINYNPIRLNGQPLDYNRLTLGSRGTLAVVVANPETEEAIKVSFRVYLRRGTAVVSITDSYMDQPLREVEIGKVLAQAQAGDELVIEPTEKSQIEAKRVIRVNGFPFCNWLLLGKKTGDGC